MKINSLSEELKASSLFEERRVAHFLRRVTLAESLNYQTRLLGIIVGLLTQHSLDNPINPDIPF